MLCLAGERAGVSLFALSFILHCVILSSRYVANFGLLPENRCVCRSGIRRFDSVRNFQLGIFAVFIEREARILRCLRVRFRPFIAVFVSRKSLSREFFVVFRNYHCCLLSASNAV